MAERSRGLGALGVPGWHALLQDMRHQGPCSALPFG